MAEQDEARQLNPVVMFDDRERDPDPNVRDFRPISDYVEKNKGRSKISDAPPNPDAPFEFASAEGSDPDAVPEPEDEQTADQPDEAPEHEPGIAPPEVDSPPAVAPEPEPVEESNGGSTDEDDIPSPWDDDTSGD